jgi:NAD(P)-dependent dehydrogenase (short-subunit alcohol dehydrogenase family)
MGGVLLVTGGSRGVGAAICRLAAQSGFKVAVNYLQSAKRANDVVSSICASGGEAVAIQADCSVELDIMRLIADVDRQLGRITALVNNAGGGVAQTFVDSTPAETLQQIVALNLTGPILCAREAVRRMSIPEGGGGGAIVNVSSMAAFNGGFAGLANYAAAKGGLESFTIALANEVGDKGIRANCIRLGAIETDAHQNDSTSFRKSMLRTIVLKRYGRPEEVAAAAVFLISEQASYITGAILNVSGGRR